MALINAISNQNVTTIIKQLNYTYCKIQQTFSRLYRITRQIFSSVLTSNNVIRKFVIMGFEWVDSTIYDCFPQNAVWCSKDKTGADIYIGQYSLEKSVLLVRIIPQKKEAYVAYKGNEIPALSYKVLVNNNDDDLIWRRVRSGYLPSNSMQCGHDGKNNKLLVGRAFHKGYLLPGYVHAVDKVIHITYGGKEYKYTDYEVLINNDTSFNNQIVNENNNVPIFLSKLNASSPNLKAGSPNIKAGSHTIKAVTLASPNFKSPMLKRSPRVPPLKTINQTFLRIKNEPQD